MIKHISHEFKILMHEGRKAAALEGNLKRSLNGKLKGTKSGVEQAVIIAYF